MPVRDRYQAGKSPCLEERVATLDSRSSSWTSVAQCPDLTSATAGWIMGSESGYRTRRGASGVVIARCDDGIGVSLAMQTITTTRSI
jgi:hypothetical protein